MEELPHYDIVKKLIGPINPIGDSGRDKVRLENLKTTIDLVNLLLIDIEEVGQNANSYESSVKEAGELALDFYKQLVDPNYD